MEKLGRGADTRPDAKAQHHHAKQRSKPVQPEMSNAAYLTPQFEGGCPTGLLPQSPSKIPAYRQNPRAKPTTNHERKQSPSTRASKPKVATNFDAQSALSRRHCVSTLSEHPTMLVCTPGSTPHPKVVSNGAHPVIVWLLSFISRNPESRISLISFQLGQNRTPLHSLHSFIDTALLIM